MGGTHGKGRYCRWSHKSDPLCSEWPQWFLCISFGHEPRPCEATSCAHDCGTIFVLHPGAGPDFIAEVKKVNDALGKQTDWRKTSGWLQLVKGPAFVLLNSRKN